MGGGRDGREKGREAEGGGDLLQGLRGGGIDAPGYRSVQLLMC